MILVFIICAILYLFMIYGVLSLYYTYRKDIEELEYRMLQNEKLSKNYCEKYWDGLYDNITDKINCLAIEVQRLKEKEKDNMACKGKRKK